LRQKFWELGFEHAELVQPRVAHYPEVEASLLLVIPAGSAEGFKPPYLGLHVVSLQVEMHALLGGLLVIGLLQQDADVGVWEPQLSIDVGAAW
jgi:hypothetical protein